MSDIEPYVPEKWIWTEADFEQMGWHDSHVYGFAAAFEEKEIIFDIDYIFQWIHPVPPNRFFSFWVAPCTLVFENVSDVHFNVNYSYQEERDGHLFGWGTPQELQDIVRTKEQVDAEGAKSGLYEVQYLGVKFRATGYKQYVRSQPNLWQAKN